MMCFITSLYQAEGHLLSNMILLMVELNNEHQSLHHTARRTMDLLNIKLRNYYNALHHHLPVYAKNCNMLKQKTLLWKQLYVHQNVLRACMHGCSLAKRAFGFNKLLPLRYRDCETVFGKSNKIELLLFWLFS